MKFPYFMAILFAIVIDGCGGTPAVLAPKAPHGGMIFDLPESRGFVEVVRQPMADQPGLCRLTLYYLDSEMKPISPPPTATLKARGRNALTIEFKPSTSPDPSTTGTLEATNIPDQGDITGELNSTMDNKAATVVINVR
jgi:hypothetical protein